MTTNFFLLFNLLVLRSFPASVFFLPNLWQILKKSDANKMEFLLILDQISVGVNIHCLDFCYYCASQKTVNPL